METLAWYDSSSPAGGVVYAVGDAGVAALAFADHDPHSELLSTLGGVRFPRPLRLVRDRHATAVVREELAAYFAGRLIRFSVAPDLRGTPFQVAVWRALLSIPYGETLSYGQVASAVGQPRAARAVGGASNRNRIGVIVPCHRVVGATGGLVGYGGGLARKELLLGLESARVRAAAEKGRTGSSRTTLRSGRW